MDDDRREEFLAAYESCRASGETDGLLPYLSSGLLLEDPQLPRGTGGRDVFLALTGELARQTRDLRIRRFGPVCVSADGAWFTQRWLGDGLAADPAGRGEGRVAFETVEVYRAPGATVERIAVLVRDLRRAGPTERTTEE